MRNLLVLLTVAALGCGGEPSLLGTWMAERTGERAILWIQEDGRITYTRVLLRATAEYPNCAEYASLHGFVVVREAPARALEVTLTGTVLLRGAGCSPSNNIPTTFTPINRREVWNYSFARGDLEVFDANRVSMGVFAIDR